MTTLTTWFKKFLTDCIDILYHDGYTLCKNILHSIAQRSNFSFYKTPPSELVSPQQTILRKKMKFSIKDFFSKCDQIPSFLRIWLHLPKKSLMENFIFCAVYPGKTWMTTLSCLNKFCSNFSVILLLRATFWFDREKVLRNVLRTTF